MGCEDKFFEWEEWDQVDAMCLQFKRCTLVRPVGKYEKGTTIETVTLDIDNELMEFWTDDGECLGAWKITLEIQEDQK